MNKDNHLIWENVEKDRVRRMVSAGYYRATIMGNDIIPKKLIVKDPRGDQILDVEDGSGLHDIWQIVYKMQDQVRSEKEPNITGRPASALAENTEQVYMVEPPLFDDILMSHFQSKGLEQVSDRETWQKVYTLNIDDVPWSVFATPEGVIIPDPEDLANVFVLPSANPDADVEVLRNYFTD